ncbi:sulfotransferase domain-containing protein [uncultured Phycicoccus sp.]|uniref:sulfotransferase domain-containing protein n=1 Tax=uncultured Phycicoccus sp. TaxID=661422 RepID=UPI0026139E5A|nr:sulfotransferase domain-containing protein [uncultured Phycicoccus sp.]
MTAPGAPQGVRQLEVPSRLRHLKKKVPLPVKAVARHATRGVGLATASRRTEPDFLVVGTKRGGTTSLWNYLVAHPDVLPMFPASREIKSPHYFDIHYDRGPRWYRSHFPTARERERHEEQTGRRALTGEASPYYMFHPLAPQRIAADLPAVKLVVSLRNPVDRIWSHYHERVAGHTESLSFDEAIDAEPARLAGEAARIVAEAPHYYSRHHDLSSYLARGHYDEQLQVLMGLFPPERLLVLRAEDFYADPAGEVAKVCEHLGLAVHGAEEFPQYNKLPRSSLPEQTRARLEEYYRPHVRATEELLGRSLDWF